MSNLDKKDSTNSKIYILWVNIKTMCYNKNSPRYKHHGAIGIKLYESWLNDYKAFHDYISSLGITEDMLGKDKLSIYRKDNSKDFIPGNIVFLNKKHDLSSGKIYFIYKDILYL